MVKETKVTIKPRYGLDKPVILDYEIEVNKGGIINRLELDIEGLRNLQAKVNYMVGLYDHK